MKSEITSISPETNSKHKSNYQNRGQGGDKVRKDSERKGIKLEGPSLLDVHRVCSSGNTGVITS